MRPFEFVLVIVSVIVGLSLTEFAIGVADMIKAYKVTHFYWPHIVFCFFGFISCLNYWGTVYKLRHVNTWTVPSIGIVFTSGLLYFVMTRMMFPDMNGFDGDYQKYFNEHFGIVLSVMILFMIFFMLESFVIRKVRKPKKYFIGIFFTMVIFSGILVTNDLYRAVLTVVLLLMQIFYMYVNKIILYDKSDEEMRFSREKTSATSNATVE